MSGQFVCVRSRTFFLTRLLNLEFEDQRKRMWCEAADVIFQKRIAYCLLNVANFEGCLTIHLSHETK